MWPLQDVTWSTAMSYSMGLTALENNVIEDRGKEVLT